MTKEKTPITPEGAGEQDKVTVNGREFKDYKEAADKMAESAKEHQRTLTEKTQEATDLQTELDDLKEEKRLAEEEAKAKEKEKEDEEEEEVPDWEKRIIDNVEKKLDKKIKVIETTLEKKTAELATEQEKRSLTEAEKKKVEDCQKEISTAQGLIPELKDEKSLPFKRVAAWLSYDPETKHITDELQKEHPEAVQRAMGNRVLLAHYYVLHLDKTLEDYLEKEARGSRVSTLGGSSKVPPKSEMTDEEFNKLPENEQDKILRADAKGRSEKIQNR